MNKILGGVLFLVVLSVAVFALRGNVAHVQPLYDHYKAYMVTAPLLPQPIDVTLTDQFGTVQGTVEQVTMFSTPVEKLLPGGEVSPIIHPDNHLTWYPFQGTAEERTLLVSNQFGTDQEWVVKDPVYLLLPAQKLEPEHPPPSGLDHYLCYDVISGSPVGVDDVTLTDQFTQEYVTVGDPVRFCNPVDKIVPDDGLPIYDNKNHLACYDIPISPNFQTSTWTFDQFAYQELLVLKNQFLCVPSTKKIKPSGSCTP